MTIAAIAILAFALSTPTAISWAGAPASPAQPGACAYAQLIAAGMMAKYDKNGDGLLDVAESLEAFPDFSDSMHAYYGADWLAQGAYTYTMKYLRFPAKDAYGVISLENWLVSKPFWSYGLKSEEVTQAVTAILCQPQPEA